MFCGEGRDWLGVRLDRDSGSALFGTREILRATAIGGFARFPVNLTDRGQLPDARHWPGKATMGETTLPRAIFAEPGLRSESIPAGFAGEQTRFRGCGIYSSCVASRLPTSRRPRGRGPFVRRRPNYPRLMSSVFVIVSSPRQRGSRLPASSMRLPGARRDRPRTPVLRPVWTCPSQLASQAVQA